jgi:hypothetical protein
LLERSPGRPGAPALREALLRWEGTSAPARSELELRFLELCRRAGIPQPLVNVRIEGLEVDFAWPGHRVAVELDGLAFHATPMAFERDRERDVTLVLAGWRVLRFTWARLVREPDVVADAVLRALTGPMAP